VSVVVVGIDQATAPLHLLEQVSVADDQLPKALASLRDQSNLSEAVILSTCLRTEVYAVVERFHDGVEEIEEFLAGLGGSSADGLAGHLTVRFDGDVVEHLFSVASGLASAVLGESEVLGQVRRAWERAQRERASGPVLGTLFRHAVGTGRRVRSETAIARGITSLSHGAVALAAERFGGRLTGSRVLVVGAGEMGDGVARALDTHDPSSVVIANRTAQRARALVGSLTGPLAERARATDLSRLGDDLVAADVVFTSVASTQPVVDRDLLATVALRREGRPPLLVVDLGMPRNVEPGAADLVGVTLLDMDALRRAVEAALTGRQGEVEHAREIIADELERYRSAIRARGAAPVIAALRARAEDARRRELDRQRVRHADLTEAQWDQVDRVTRATMATLLHQPTVALKDAAGTSRGERLVESLRSLFDL